MWLMHSRLTVDLDMWSPISEWSVLLEDKLMRIDFVNGFKRCLAVCIIALITVTSVWGQETRNRTTYYHSTLQGTPVAATNESGDIKWSQSYASYGLHSGNSQEIEESSLVFGASGACRRSVRRPLAVVSKSPVLRSSNGSIFKY